jgi:hypothetical protein
VSVNWQPSRIFSIQVSLPYVWNSGEDKTIFMEYEARGLGDARITAWVDMTEWSYLSKIESAQDGKSEDEVPDEFLEDPFAEITGTSIREEKKEKGRGEYPHFRLGLGVKLPTGDHDVKDSSDRSLPARFQPGWGVASPVVGAGYRQSFGDFNVVGTLVYEISGGENSEDYEHDDILRFDFSVYYPLYQPLSLIGGLGYSLTNIRGEDYDRGLEVGDTDGSFHSIVVTGLIGVYRGLSAIVVVKIPFGSAGSNSVNDVDFQYSAGLSYSF